MCENAGAARDERSFSGETRDLGVARTVKMLLPRAVESTTGETGEMIMTTSLRSLLAVAVLFAGVTGCAASNDESEPANDEQSENADQKKADEKTPVVEEGKLAIQKKRQEPKK